MQELGERFNEFNKNKDGGTAEPDTVFTEDDVKDIIDSFPKNKASGLDKTKINTIKQIYSVIKDPLKNTIISCIREGIFPESLKQKELVIIRKVGMRDWQNPRSYGPITLLPELGRIYEKVLAKIIIDRMENAEGFDTSKQYGFTKGRSAEDAATELRNIMESCEGKYAMGMFLDIDGAFDSSW